MNLYRPVKKEPKPKDGDTKTVKRFTLFKRIDDTVVILGYYTENFEWHERTPTFARDYSRWISRGFETIN